MRARESIGLPRAVAVLSVLGVRATMSKCHIGFGTSKYSGQAWIIMLIDEHNTFFRPQGNGVEI